MKKQTVIVLINKTAANDYVNKDTQGRIDVIKAACESAENLISYKNQSVSSSEIRAIIVAPEYFLSKKSDGILYINRDEMVEARNKIMEVSKKYKNIVIVPGSVAYYKQIQNNDKGIARAKKALDRLDNEIKSSSSIKIHANDGSEVKDQIAYNNYVATWNNKLNNIINNGMKDNVFIYSNSMLVFFNGNIWKHRKSIGFNENKNAPNELLSINRPDTSGIVNIAGRTFGLEICYEHNRGTLSSFTAKTAVDFHLVVSDWVSTGNSDKINLKYDGYFIHSSTQYNENSVLNSKLNPTYTVNTGNDFLMYVINTPEKSSSMEGIGVADVIKKNKPMALK
jgi:predicted amidohydrolase